MNFLPNFFDDAINKDICIIGKGRSVDQIDKKVLENCYIINVNDSHKIFQGHVSIMPERFYDPDSVPAKSILISSMKTERPRSLFVDDFQQWCENQYYENAYIQLIFPYRNLFPICLHHLRLHKQLKQTLWNVPNPS